MRIACAIVTLIAAITAAQEPPIPKFHLTPRPFVDDPLDREAILDMIEPVCRFAVQHQDESGAFIDPVLGKEHQYSTPYLAYAIGCLTHAGRAPDLVDAGIEAVDHATKCFAGGRQTIPDDHGEFFLASLAGALRFYEGMVSEEKMDRWRARLSKPLFDVIEGPTAKTNNWRTYAMRGEWARVQARLADDRYALSFIEDGWLRRTQRERIVLDRWNMYQDWNGHPQSHAVEAVGRGNLLALAHALGGRTSVAIDMLKAVRRGTETSLLFVDPTGQCPPNGRTDNHVFNDVLYGLCFDIMAEHHAANGGDFRAGQYRRAADLCYRSIARWKIDTGEYAGSYSITKNFFPPEDRVGYQPASQVSNYSGAVVYHLAEAYEVRKTEIEPKPSPAEIGGYIIEADPRFGSAVANAGGMQVFINLLGDSVPKYGKYWTPLGIARFARADWDSRLGPSDGIYDAESRRGVTFGPAWKVGRRWMRLSERADDYRGTLRHDFANPVMTKCSVLYAPVTGVGGPSFFHDLTITPDGVHTVLWSPHDVEFALTIPLLTNDGRPLETSIGERIVTTQHPGGDSSQNFLIVQGGSPVADGDPIQSTYGWIQPVRVGTVDGRVEVFVYPRSASQPTPEDVIDSFESSQNTFTSILGAAKESVYINEDLIGGLGNSVELEDLRIEWNQVCGFIIQRSGEGWHAIETSESTSGRVFGENVEVEAYTPLYSSNP